jgi:hypothetical protein
MTGRIMARRKNNGSGLRRLNMLNSKNARKQRFRHAGSKASAQAAIKKGIELPINTLVIIVVAVIVIIAIAAFFMGGFGGSTRDIQNKQTFLNTCSGWVQTGCNANDAISISDAKKAFLNWQPTKNDGSGSVITPSGVSEIDYLASMCGCFGASVEPRVSTGGSPAPALPAVP